MARVSLADRDARTKRRRAPIQREGYLFDIVGDWRIYDINGAGDEYYLARSEEEAIAAASDQWSGDDIECVEELSEGALDRLQFQDDDGTKRSFREELARRVADNPEPSLFASTDH